MRYVLIGGLAAVTQGASLVTQDVDVCHARDADNLARLADALREVHAKLRGAEPSLPFRLDARTLAKGDAFTFTTDLGAIDLLATPAGTEVTRTWQGPPMRSNSSGSACWLPRSTTSSG